ncbi:MAG: zinc-dependent alcohol dehydrogenase family protein [Rhodospirillaceae bacterium]|nr:zinc-dependent alcohol dehydrogenase family protein [Rhodospirillaceae bacterium]
MMQVLQQIGHGDARTALALIEAPVPIAAPGEIVVRMEVAAIHQSDVLNLADEKRTPHHTLPRIGGTEGVGRVHAVGDGVITFTVGQRVFPPKYSGLFRTYVPCVAANCYAAPDDCDAEALSIVQTMGLTAYLLLEDYVKLPPGAWIIHDAANSSIGRIIIGLARHRGLRTVNVVRRAGFDNELKALGADVVVVDTDGADEFAARVKQATGNADIAIGLDMIGGAVAGRLAHCLADQGTLVLYGGSGPDAAQVAFTDLARRNLTVTGMGMSRAFNRRSANEKAHVMATLGELAASGIMKTNIAARYRLSDYAAAFAHAGQPNAQRNGKVIFRF